MDSLHEDLNRADKFTNLKKMKEIESLKRFSTGAEEEETRNFAKFSDEQLELLAYEAWKEHLNNNRSIIVDLFQG